MKPSWAYSSSSVASKGCAVSNLITSFCEDVQPLDKSRLITPVQTKISSCWEPGIIIHNWPLLKCDAHPVNSGMKQASSM